MKICMLVTSNVIKDPRVQKEALIASENGMEVYVLGRKDELIDQKPLESRPYKVILIDKIRTESDGLLKRIIERISFGISLYKKCLQIMPDIIHANDFDTLPFAWLASRRLNCSIVYDSHEIWSENGRVAKHWLAKKIIQLFEGFLIKRVDKVVSVSNAAASKLEEMYKIEKPQVVTNCPYFYPNISKTEKKGGFEVVYQGMFAPDRGYEEFVLSAKELNDDVKLILRGYGPIENKLKRLVKDNHLEGKVIFDNPVDVFELPKAASTSHVGVVLTKPVSINFEYTVSNKLFEYIQAGIPVILSDVKEHRYLVDKYNFGLIIDKVEPKQVAEAIMKLYKDEKLYEELRKNAIKAKEDLCWEVEGTKLINIYNQIYLRTRDAR